MFFKFHKTWIAIVKRRASMESLAGTSLLKGLGHLAIAGIILGILNGLFNYLNNRENFGTITDIGYSVVITPTMLLLGALAWGAVLWIIGKLLKGKAIYGELVGTLSLVSAAVLGAIISVLALANILAGIAGNEILGIISVITSTATIIALLYLTFLHVKATKAVEQFRLLKAAIVILLPGILAIAAYALIVLPLLAAINV